MVGVAKGDDPIMKNGGKVMTEILKWLLVVAACGGLFFASFVTIRYLGQKLREEEENSDEAGEADKAKTPKTEEKNEDEISIEEIEQISKKEEELAENEEIAPAPEAETVEEKEEEADKAPVEPDDDEEEKVGFALSDFDKSLIDFIEDSGYKNENYMVSPASFRAVIGLAVAGADSDTKTELLKAAGFKDEAEFNQWYINMVNAPDTNDVNVIFKILNSAWHNTRLKGALSPDYMDYIKAHYGAESKDVAAGEITKAVNDWVNDGTNGLIPSIADDLSAADMVLVNTLYLKASWLKTFETAFTEEGDFKAYDGCSIKKEFMNKTDNYRYYEDEKSKLLVMSMYGDIDVVYVLGDSSNIQDKLLKATEYKVHVKVPKFETETSFDKKELVKFLQSRGAKSAFAPGADFSAMSTETGFYISDIIQKTKIVTDEEGIEATAASGMVMLGMPLNIETDDPKEFIADEPFKYYIITSSGAKEILFYGQIVE